MYKRQAPSKEKFLNSFEQKENLRLDVFINYLRNKECLGKDISFGEIKECSNELKCEVYCSYNVSQEDIDDGELSEEIMYAYFNKINGRIYLNRIEFGGR